MEGEIPVIMTDYGPVPLSKKTLNYLSSLDENWSKVAANKRRRGKHARHVRQKLLDVENAACTLATIIFCDGGLLKEF